MRLFDYDSIFGMLDQFDVPKNEFKHATIFRVERLTPDSYALAINTRDEKCFVLYGEDYISSIEYLKEQIEGWLPSRLAEFIKPKNPIKFEDTANSRYYLQPDYESISQWEGYAIPAETYYVFLAQIDPDKENDSYYIASITGGNDRVRITKTDDIPDVVKKHLTKQPLNSKDSFLESWHKKKREGDI